MYFIDTNVFIEVLLRQEHHEECEGLLRKIDSGAIDCFCSHFSVHSVCAFLHKRKMVSEARAFLDYLLSLKNLVVLNTSLEDDLEILKVQENTGLDFDDSLQYYLSQQAGCQKIITFDSDFEKAGIATLKPRNVQ